MTIEEAIHAHLKAHASVSALAGDRVYPKVMPQKPTYPAIVYHRISGVREPNQQGPSGLTHPRFQFDCYGATYAAAKGLADAVRFALDGFQGTMGGGPHVSAAFVENDADDYDDELGIHRQIVDVVIWHEEAVAP